MYDWGFFITSSFSLRNLNTSPEGAECSAPRTFRCAALLGDRSGTFHSRFDGQTPGLRGSCLSHSRPPSRLRLYDLFLLFDLFLLLHRFWLFDLFLLLLQARLSPNWWSTLVLEWPQSSWLCSAHLHPRSGTS